MAMSVFTHPSLFHLQYYTSEMLFIWDLFVLQLEQQQCYSTVHFYPPLPIFFLFNNVALVNHIHLQQQKQPLWGTIYSLHNFVTIVYGSSIE